MAITERFARMRARLRHLGRGSRKGPAPDAEDGHAPGHRHLPRPDNAPTPPPANTKPDRDQPWVRTSHSDSQTRRPRS